MKRTSTQLLMVALALSLCVHTIVAAFVRHATVEAMPEERPLITTVTRLHRPPPPTPRPTQPPKTPAHPISAPVAPTVHVPTLPKDSGHTGGAVVGYHPGPPGPTPGMDGGGEGPVPLATAEPTDTPKPACSAPNVAASAIDPITPDKPEGAEDVSGRAEVRVTLTADGAVESAEIYRSTGNLLLDRAALRAARQSHYRAELRDCAPVHGQYLFTVDFTG